MHKMLVVKVASIFWLPKVLKNIKSFRLFWMDPNYSKESRLFKDYSKALATIIKEKNERLIRIRDTT